MGADDFVNVSNFIPGFRWARKPSFRFATNRLTLRDDSVEGESSMFKNPRRLIALGVALTCIPSLAISAIDKSRSYVANNSLLELDGFSIGFIKSISGGEAVQPPVLKGARNDKYPNKVPGTLRYEDVKIEIPVTAPTNVWDWVNALSSPNPVPRHRLTITDMDFDRKAVARRQMDEMLLNTVEIPELDGSSKDVQYVKLSMSPGRVKEETPDASPVATTGTKTKAWTTSAFRVSIDGLATNRISKVSPLTIGRNSKGELEYSNLKFTFSEVDVPTWKQWAQETATGKPVEKSGQIQLLGPNMTDVLLTIQLDGLGLIRLAKEAAVSNTDTVSRSSAELYVEKVTFTSNAK